MDQGQMEETFLVPEEEVYMEAAFLAKVRQVLVVLLVLFLGILARTFLETFLFQAYY